MLNYEPQGHCSAQHRVSKYLPCAGHVLTHHEGLKLESGGVHVPQIPGPSEGSRSVKDAAKGHLNQYGKEFIKNSFLEEVMLNLANYVDVNQMEK